MKRTLDGSLLRSSGRALSRVEKGLNNGAGLILFAIMMLSVADVGLRYLFNSPIKWSYPLIAEYLMIYSFFLAVADTFRRSQHITIEFLVSKLHIRTRSIAELVGYIPALVVFGLIFWLGTERTWAQYVNHDAKIDSLGWPSWIASVAVPIGIGTLFLRVVVRMGALWVRIGEPDIDVTAAYGEIDTEGLMAPTKDVPSAGVSA